MDYLPDPKFDGPRHKMPDRAEVKGFHPSQWPDGHWKRTGWLTYHNQPIYHGDQENYAVEYTPDPQASRSILPPPNAAIGVDKWVEDEERWKSTGWQLHGQTIYFDVPMDGQKSYAVYGERSKHDGGRRRTRKRNFRRNNNKTRAAARRSSQRHYRCASSRR